MTRLQYLDAHAVDGGSPYDRAAHDADRHWRRYEFGIPATVPASDVADVAATGCLLRLRGVASDAMFDYIAAGM
jgi:hypothetical protein